MSTEDASEKLRALRDSLLGTSPCGLADLVDGPQLEVLCGLFTAGGAPQFTVGPIDPVPDGATALPFTATFDSLLDVQDVAAHFNVFYDADGQRQVLFYFQVPPPPDGDSLCNPAARDEGVEPAQVSGGDHGADDRPGTAGAYLNRYADPLTSVNDSDKAAPNTRAADLLPRLDLAVASNQVTFVYSSLDYTGAEASAYPADFAAVRPATKVRAGLNFDLQPLTEGALGLLSDLLGDKTTADLVAGVVCAGDDGPYFRVTQPLAGAAKSLAAVEGLSFKFEEVDLALPLANHGRSWPVTTLKGAVRIPGATKELRVTADLDLFASALTLTFDDFPSLGELISLAGGDEVKAHFISPFHKLLDVTLDELRIVLAPNASTAAGVVAEVRLVVGGPSLTLLTLPDGGGSIGIAKPCLTLDITAPLNSDARRLDGTISGEALLGAIAFDTCFAFPSGDFDLKLKTETIPPNSLGELIKGSEIPWGKVTRLEFSGNFNTGSYAAGVAIDGDGVWTFDLAGETYGLNSVSLDIGFVKGEAGYEVSCGLGCELEVGDTCFDIAGQYDTKAGLSITGRTAPDDSLDLTKLPNNLMNGMDKPADLPPLKLRDLIFSASPNSKAYLFSTRTDGAWPLGDSLSLNIGHFSVGTQAGLAIAGTLAGPEGGPINLADVISEMATRLGADATVPDALNGVTIDSATASFSSLGSKTNFTFACEAKYPADGGKADMRLYVSYDGDKVDGKSSYTVGFTGLLGISGQVFSFDLAKVEGAGASDLLLLATYQNEQQADLVTLLAAATGDTLDSPVAIDVKDIFFAYAVHNGVGRYLFGLALNADVDLGKFLGDHVKDLLGGASASLGVQDLRVLYASGDGLTLLEVKTINGKLAGAKIGPLPELPPPGPVQAATPGLAGGLSVGATLSLPGGNTVKVAAPRTGTASAPAQTVPATPAEGAPAAPAPSAPAPQPSAAAAVPPPAGASWFDVQKSLGPFFIDKIGVRYADGRVWFLLNAGLRTGGLTLDVVGLGLGVKPSLPVDADFALSGLGLDFKAGGVSITGVFLKGEVPVYDKLGKPTTESMTQYAGEVRIGLPTLSIVGVGAYGQLRPAPSEPALFLYAALSFAEGEGIGSPPVVITGLALGFGINYRVEIPTIDKVSTFPLVAMVMGPGGTPPPGTAADTPGQTLNLLLGGPSPSLTVSPGQYFGAIGLRFSLFEQIDAFALAVVRAAAGGADLEIALLGLGRFKEPQEGEAICYIELALLVDIRPAEGVMRIEAQLTANSWVFDSSCRLTGGFALVIWFGGPQRGDFVLSIGGYHPQFQAPPYYPVVPRLGLNFQIGSLVIKGQAYFALTPEVVMAGGRLEATYASGSVRASFVAYVDFVMYWKPLKYAIQAGIAIHVSVDLWLFTIDVTLSVDLALAGPPFHGIARVHVGPVSFTIQFGGEPAKAQKLDWNQFVAGFLDRTPAEQLAGGQARTLHQLNLAAGQVTRAGAPAAKPPAPAAKVRTLAARPAAFEEAAARGAGANGDGAPKVWLVRADELVLTFSSALPASTLYVGQAVAGDAAWQTALDATQHAPGAARENPQLLPVTQAGSAITTATNLAIRPMDVQDLQSSLILTIVDEENPGPIDGLNDWTLEADRTGLPAAVWQHADLEQTPAPGSKLIDGCIVGVRRFSPPAGKSYGEPQLGVTHEALGYDLEDSAAVQEEPVTQAAPAPSGGSLPPVDDGAAKLRGAVAAALAAAGFVEFAALATLPGWSRPLEAVPMTGSPHPAE